jgi:hypothetical protein
MSTYVSKRARELGIPVQDAKRPLKIRLSSSDIQRGKKKNNKACAFACAATHVPGVTRAYIFRTAAILEYDNKMVRYMLSPAMRREVLAFDRGGTMEPGDYTLKHPTGGHTKEAYEARSKKRPGRHQPGKGKIRRKVVQTPNMRTMKEPA